MSIKGPNISSGETKTSNASSADNLSVLWQTIHETTTQAHSALRDDFNRAQDEFRLNRHDKAEATLRTLVGYLNNAITKKAPEASESGQLAALRAAAHWCSVESTNGSIGVTKRPILLNARSKCIPRCSV